MPGARNRVRCPDCGAGNVLMYGSGKCSRCYGSGVNTSLNRAEDKCPNCKGLGACPTCGGSGSVPNPLWNGVTGRLRLVLISAAVLLGLGYCGFLQQRNVSLGKAATETFHERFSAEQDDQIYFESDQAWTNAIGLDAERSLFTKIRRKMGACSYSDVLAWRAHSNTNFGGTVVTLTFQAKCANGLMRESFAWRIVSGKARLVSYNAQSKLLSFD